MFQKFPRRTLFYLALSVTGLLLFATLRQTPPVSAQGSTQYVITLKVEQNRDCRVGTYSVETPEGVELERLTIIGAKAGDELQCSLVFSGEYTSIGTIYVAGIGAITGPLDLLQVQGQHRGERIHFKMLSLGRQPPVDEFLVQQQLILYLGE